MSIVDIVIPMGSIGGLLLLAFGVGQFVKASRTSDKAHAGKLEKHGDKLEGHGTRLTKIETRMGPE